MTAQAGNSSGTVASEPAPHPLLSGQKFTVGIIAGNGRFPLDAARRARELGHHVLVVAHRGETNPAIAEFAHELCWVRVGQLGAILRFFRRAHASFVAMAGGISRVRLFGGARPDLEAIRLIARVGSTRDDVLLRAVAAELEREGASVFSAGLLLDRAIPGREVLTSRGLSEAERADARVGFPVAHELGRLDIGQTVVVFQGLVVALEAVEGTDAAIRRAGQLTAGARSGGWSKTISAALRHEPRSGLVVVKCCKPQQDVRIDLPTVGVQTIDSMREAGATALVVEAGRTLLLDPNAVVQAAERAGIAVVAVGGIDDLK